MTTLLRERDEVLKDYEALGRLRGVGRIIAAAVLFEVDETRRLAEQGGEDLPWCVVASLARIERWAKRLQQGVDGV